MLFSLETIKDFFYFAITGPGGGCCEVWYFTYMSVQKDNSIVWIN